MIQTIQSTIIFNPNQFLQQYYQSPDLHQQEIGMQDFQKLLFQYFDQIPQCEFGLELGCGPSLLMSAYVSRKVKNLILSQYNPECLQYLNNWLSKRNQQKGFNWTPHFERAAQMQNQSAQNIQKRIRQRILSLLHCDMRNPNIFTTGFIKKVDVITSICALQAAARTEQQYYNIIKNSKRYLKKGGYFCLLGVLQQTFYMVGDKKLPILYLKQDFLRRAFEQNGFELIKFSINYVQNPPQKTSDYKGLFGIFARNLD